MSGKNGKRNRRKQKKAALNKKIIVILAAMVVIIAGIATAICMWSRQNSETGRVVNVSEDGEGAVESDSQTDTEADWYNLPGYINGVEKDAEQTICGVALPYQVQDTPIIIEGIGQYTGPFVEDGNDEPEANVLAIVVRNGSDADVEYAEVHFSTGDGSEAVFHISTLPAGSSAVVLEQNKREYNAEETLAFADKLYAQAEEMSLMEDDVRVTAEDGALTLENLTDQSLGTVYVRYKNKLNDNYYLGGITYSCKFENVGAGDEITEQTKHFTVDGSTVLMVKAIEE